MGLRACLNELNEMISDPEYKIGRPRQLFNGSVRRDVQR
jgi:citrate synthase